MANHPDRREFVSKLGILGATAALLPHKTLKAACVQTPEQVEGPFYPEEYPLDTDTDLTWLDDSDEQALGTVILVHGTVLGSSCEPVAGALVELWQACESGRYNHADDDNPAALDPNFQYYGRVRTDESGRYAFLTVKPGAYPDNPTWMRPPHIHFKITATDFGTLTTQMYFAGEPLNRRDRILRDLTAEEKRQVVIPFVEGSGDDLWSLQGQFDISLLGEE